MKDSMKNFLFKRHNKLLYIRAPCEIDAIKCNYFHENCRKMICFMLDNFSILLYKNVYMDFIHPFPENDHDARFIR